MGRETPPELPAENCCGASRRCSHGRGAALLAAGLIVLATVAAFSNSFAGPLIFDDQTAIAANPTIRQLWPLGKVLSPPSHGETVSGRPLLNLSLALNYAAGQCDVRAYHITNLAIHIAAALLLFGIARRTVATYPKLLRGLTAPPAATSIALAIALLWAVHPLQTESVTYIAQRAESLMGLFYLLTLYCFLRGAGSDRAFLWYAGSVLACLLGMATKEVMVTAPLVVLLYDRTFLAGSFREALRRRWRYYLALATAWLLLLWLVARTGLLHQSYDEPVDHRYELTWWAYLATEPGVIVRYLRLAFWPAGLCFDYCWPAAATWQSVLFPAIPVASLLGLTVWALVKRPAWGFLGAWFFLILAPTSSFLPLKEAAAFEHRMYLPLAAVVSCVVLGAYLAAQWLAGRMSFPPVALRAVGGCTAACAAIALGTATFHRNESYRSELAIWQDTVDKAPGSYRAHNNLGNLLEADGQVDAAIFHYQQALDVKPDFADAHNNLGLALAGRGRIDEAIGQYQEALRLQPDFTKAHYNLGIALAGRGQSAAAIFHYQRAVDIDPDFADAHNNLGLALVSRGQVDQAISEYRKALEIKPDDVDAHNNLGIALAGLGRVDEAIAQYQQALKIKPNFADAHNNLGVALAGCGKVDAAIAQYQQALEIKPDFADAHNNLGNLLVGRGEVEAAIVQYQKALKTKPNLVDAHYNLGLALAGRGRLNEAIVHYQQAVEIKPDYLEAHDNLGLALAERGRLKEAIEHCQKAFDLASARSNRAAADVILAHIKLLKAAAASNGP